MHDSEQEHRGITGCRVTYDSTIFYNAANKFSIPKKQNGRYSQDTLLWTLILYGRSPGMNRISPTCAEDGR